MAFPTARAFIALSAATLRGEWGYVLGVRQTHFSSHVWRMVVCLAALAVTFTLYVRAKHQVVRSHEVRFQSFHLADELRHSGDDLTRMARTYVVTGDPVYLQHFRDILAIRDGKQPRPDNYSRPYWDLVLKGDAPPRASGEAVPLLELMRRAGFTEREFQKLAEAKTNSDRLTIPEFQAMSLVESGGPDAEVNRARARTLMFDEEYHQAKASVMGPINEAFELVDARTLAAVHSAEWRAMALRSVFVVFGLASLFTLWRTYAALGDTLGGSVDELRAHITRIGNGDLSTAMVARRGREDSVLAWLSETQDRLRGIERERRHAAEARAQLASIVDSSADAIVGTTLAGEVTSWNAAAERLFGYTAAEMIGTSIDRLAPPTSLVEDPALSSVDFRGPPSEGYDAVRIAKDGRAIDVSLAISPVSDESGRIIGASTIARDIAARKRADLEIRTLNAELERRVEARTALLDGVSQAQAAFIMEGNLWSASAMLLDTFLALTHSEYGFIDELEHDSDGRPSLIARAITNVAWSEETRAFYPKFLTGELRFDNMTSLFGAVVTTGAPVIANDAPNDPRRCGLPVGHPPLNAFLGLPLRAGSELVGVVGLANAPGGYSEETIEYLAPMTGACALLIGAARNERMRQQGEERLRDLNARLAEGAVALEAANSELEAFSYSVSHDLRAPLRAIDGYSRIVLEDYHDRLDDEGRRVLGVVSSETRRMGQLIDALLTFSRLSRHDLTLADVDMTDLARSAFQEVIAVAPERRIRFDAQAVPRARGEPLMLRQVWINLLANAVKFTGRRDDAAIEVGWRQDPEPAYYVRDNGVGFDMAHTDRLFGVFQRLHAETDFPGTGIGLALVHRIIARHGGRVWAEARINEGATFYFTLSADKEERS